MTKIEMQFIDHLDKLLAENVFDKQPAPDVVIKVAYCLLARSATISIMEIVADKETALQLSRTLYDDMRNVMYSRLIETRNRLIDTLLDRG